MEIEGKIRNLQVSEKKVEASNQEYELIKEEKRKLAEEQIFIPSSKEPGKVRLNGRIYGIFIDQSIFCSKVGSILGTPVQVLNQGEGNHSFNQSFLRQSFFELTGFPTYWDNLQCFLDYVSTYMYGKRQGYEYDSFTERKVRTLYSQIDFRLKGALEIALRNHGTDSLRLITPSEYRKRVDDYRSVMLQEMDADFIQLESPLSKKDSFISTSESRQLKKSY